MYEHTDTFTQLFQPGSFNNGTALILLCLRKQKQLKQFHLPPELSLSTEDKVRETGVQSLGVLSCPVTQPIWSYQSWEKLDLLKATLNDGCVQTDARNSWRLRKMNAKVVYSPFAFPLISDLEQSSGAAEFFY